MPDERVDHGLLVWSSVVLCVLGLAALLPPGSIGHVPESRAFAVCIVALGALGPLFLRGVRVLGGVRWLAHWFLIAALFVSPRLPGGIVGEAVSQIPYAVWCVGKLTVLAANLWLAWRIAAGRMAVSVAGRGTGTVRENFGKAAILLVLVCVFVMLRLLVTRG
jgi:hypothetical protein